MPVKNWAKPKINQGQNCKDKFDKIIVTPKYLFSKVVNVWDIPISIINISVSCKDKACALSKLLMLISSSSSNFKANTIVVVMMEPIIAISLRKAKIILPSKKYKIEYDNQSAPFTR